MTLNSFNNYSLIRATADLFAQLGVPLISKTEQALEPKAVLNELFREIRAADFVSPVRAFYLQTGMAVRREGRESGHLERHRYNPSIRSASEDFVWRQ